MILAGHMPTTARYELPFNQGKVYRVYDEETDCIFYELDWAAMACAEIVAYAPPPQGSYFGSWR